MKYLIWIIFLFISCNNSNITEKAMKEELEDEKILTSESKKDKSKEIKIIEFNSKHSFNDYEVPIFKGKLANPNFKNNPFADNPEYVKFITEGCKKNSVNFAGHYTAITKSCGMSCIFLFLIDRITGEILIDVSLNEEENQEDGRYGYEFKPNSTMLIANSSLFIDNDFKFYQSEYQEKPELYEWTGNKFKKLKLLE